MKRIIVLLTLAVLPLTVAFAQEKIAGDLSVDLGVISWEEIQASAKEKPLTQREEFHRKMAKSMMAMHGGGSKDTYHVMVMLFEKSTRKDVQHADVMVTAVAKAGPEEITQKLQRMSMDDMSGFGEYFELTFKGPYMFKVDIQKGYRLYTTEFERTIH